MSRQPWLELTIPGEPVPKARPRVTSHGSYTPPRTRQKEQDIQALYRADHPGAVSSLYQRFELHVTAFRKSKQRADVDNFAKLVMDALNGLVWEDDSQVVKLVAEKVGVTTNPHTEIRVYLLQGRT